MHFNPHSIQKQARKWPVSFYSNNLNQDIKARIQQIWQTQIEKFYDPFKIEFAVDEDLITEYGLDCCRLAQIEAQGSKPDINLLESAYKWLNKFTQQLNEPDDNSQFMAPIWFEAALRTKDHILSRNKIQSGLATTKKALKTSPLCKGMSKNDFQLVLCCLYPFIPLTVGHYNNIYFSSNLPQTVPGIFSYYPELIMINYRIGNGGWYWTVVNKDEFLGAPMATLKNIKQVKLATKDRNASLKKVAGGYHICLN